MMNGLPVPKPGDCGRLSHPNTPTVVFAAFITVGILASYLPQHRKIIARGSSTGLSPYWVLLGGLSSIAAIGNILVLPASRDDMKCCRDIGLGSCVAALLGVAQIGTQFCCFMLIVLLFLIYSGPTPELRTRARRQSETESAPEQAPPHHNVAVTVAGTILVALFGVSFVSLIMLMGWPHHTQNWANVLGIIAGILSGIQYLPQIYYTYLLKDVKSLSILTMFIQVPGAFLFALSLWLRVGWEGWSAWAVYLVTATLQSMLLAMAIVFSLRESGYGQQGDTIFSRAYRRMVGKNSSGVDDVDGTTETNGGDNRPPDESTALLGARP